MLSGRGAVHVRVSTARAPRAVVTLSEYHLTIRYTTVYRRLRQSRRGGGGPRLGGGRSWPERQLTAAGGASPRTGSRAAPGPVADVARNSSSVSRVAALRPPMPGL